MQYDHLYTVVVACTSPDEDRSAIYDQAQDSVLRDRKWRDYVAVMHPNGKGQIIGYRRLNPKDWFRMSSDGEVTGPYHTLRIVQRALNADHYTRTPFKGVYLIKATGHYGGRVFLAFTRDAAPDLALNPEGLPC